MKKALVLGMAILAATHVFADGKMDKHMPDMKDGEGMEHREHRHHGRPDMSVLNLTEEQKTKMKAMHAKHVIEMKALHDKHKSEMKTILTAEQWAKMEEMRPERHKGQSKPPKAGKMEAGNKAPMPPAKAAATPVK